MEKEVINELSRHDIDEIKSVTAKIERVLKQAKDQD